VGILWIKSYCKGEYIVTTNVGWVQILGSTILGGESLTTRLALRHVISYKLGLELDLKIPRVSYIYPQTPPNES
jgi:hypothetical protein